MTSMRPFRWNLSRPEQLVHLSAGTTARTPLDLDDLRRCAARVLGLAGNADLVFVGRSPESLFDYLSGVLYGSSWEARLNLLLFSARGWPVRSIRRAYPGAVEAMHTQLGEIGLAPDQLVRRSRPLAFVDLVASGETFGHLNGLLEEWSTELGLTPRSWRSRIRFIGIVAQGKNSPNAWRWSQHADWLHAYPPGAARNVSVPWPLWDFLGNRQAKVTPSNPPSRWGDEALCRPPRESGHLEALRGAAEFFNLGCQERAPFAALLAAQPTMRQAWFRALVLDLRSRTTRWGSQ